VRITSPEIVIIPFKAVHPSFKHVHGSQRRPLSILNQKRRDTQQIRSS